VLRPINVFCLIAVLALLASSFAVAQTPTISSISPNPGGIGQSVTIGGSNFGTSGSVTFNGVTASTTNWTSTSIIATVPAGGAGNVVVTVNGTSSRGFSFALNNGPVNYVYDDLGRLAGVIDVNGNAAEYSYDAVGNILSISRFTGTQVSIINFSPESGPIGAAVTINGTAFSSTASQNTVQFNGTAAVVSSATNSQLQVTVPSSAAPGPISVTSPNGSATSTENFTVTSSNGAPTITSFSPTSGSAGTTVSVTGTNFDPTLSNDKLRMNASQAVVSTVNSTTIGTTVPVATASGHFTLIAPAGNAVSSQDFYVPFLTHVPGDIGFTARITPGGSQPVTLGANQIAMVLFDGIEGQHAEIGWSGTTFSTCNLYLIAPDNSTTATTACTAGSTDLASTYLPKSGTYTIGIDPGTSSGSLTLSLNMDIVGSIGIGGPPVTETTTMVGQDVRLNFAPTANQHIVVHATNVSNPSATVNVITQSGSVVASMAISNSPSGQTFFLETPLAAGELYQLWVQHSGTNVGSETLQIIPDFTGTLTIPSAGTAGPTVQVPTTGNLTIGQNASLTFNGTAGQQLSYNVTNSTIGSCNLTVNDPNNTTITFGNCGSGTSYINEANLALTGTYTVYVAPQGTSTGSAGVSINNDQDVTTPSISIGGNANTYSMIVGQDVRLSFTPSTNKRIVMYATNVTYGGSYVNLYVPSTGTTQASLGIENDPGYTWFMDTQSLVGGTTYQLWIPHYLNDSGNVTLQIGSVPNDVTGTLTVPAAGATGPTKQVPASGSLAVGQNASLTFHGTSGQQLSFNTINSTIGTCALSVSDPNANQILSGQNCGTGNNLIGPVTLQLTGTYTVFLNPAGMSTGSVGVSINNDQDVTTPTITIGGPQVQEQTTVAGQDIRLSFTASANQRIVVTASNSTIAEATLNLQTPSGSTQASAVINNNSGYTAFIDTQTLAAGTNQLWVQHYGANTGSVYLQIGNVPADISQMVTIGGSAYQFSTVAGQNANITFSNPTSESVTVHWTSGTYPNSLGCNIAVTGPSPATTQVGSGNCNTTTGALSLGTLASGTYDVLVDPQQWSAGGMSLTVTTP
jgi:YD repeat-containing protein